MRTTHRAEVLLIADGVTSWILRQSSMCWKQERMIAKHHDDRWTKLISTWSPVITTKQKVYRVQGGPAERWEDDVNSYQQPIIVHGDNNDLTNDMTWLTTAHDGSKWDPSRTASL